MKSILEIKQEIVELHKKWKAAGESLDNFKVTEIYEHLVDSLLLDYCKENKYDIDEYPFLHRELGKTDEKYNDDYFSDRNDLYLFSLANKHKDVFELYHFYSNLFWPDYYETEDVTRNTIKREIEYSPYDFKING